MVAAQPNAGHPLRLALQPVDFGEELRVGALLVAVDEDHVEVVAVDLLHLARLLDDLLQLVVLHGPPDSNKSDQILPEKKTKKQNNNNNKESKRFRIGP